MTRSPPGTWRLLGAASVAWALMAWTLTVPGAARWIAWGTGLLGLVLFLGWPRAWRVLAIVCAVLMVLDARVDLGEWQRGDEALVTAAETGRSVHLAATLQGFAEEQAGGTFDSHEGGASWVRATVSVGRGPVPILLWMDTPPDPRLVPGGEVTITGTVEALGHASSSAFGLSVTQMDVTEPGPIGRAVADLRRGLSEAAARVPGAELVPGFAVGDTSLVSDELQEQMTHSSLTHLVAVSGANCALVTSALISVASRLRAGRRLRIVLAAGALGGFVLIVGPDSSVQRAAVMAAVVLASNYGGKHAHALPSLGIAMIGLLCVDPWQALQPGFALSVAATAGILLLVPPVLAIMNGVVRLPEWVALPISVAISAQFACGPLLLLVQPDLPMVGVLANILAGPAVPLGTGLGLLALLSLPVLPIVGTALVHLAALPARWVAATAEISAQLPLARWSWPESWAGATLLAFTQALLVVAWLLSTGRIGLPGGARATGALPWHSRERQPLSIRVAIAVAVSGACGLFASVTLVVPMTFRAGIPRDWVIVACDVAQGDALLIRNPGQPNDIVLVDTGDEPELLQRCLDQFSIDRISLLVLTHDHRDHVGALETLRGRVDHAMIAPPNREDQSRDPEREVERRLEDLGIPFDIGVGGMTSAPNAGVTWEVLAPAPGSTPPDSNAGSLVLSMQSGPLSILMLGDTGLAEHQQLRAGSADVSADIVKVAHHGSRDADPALIEQSGADAGLISVGEDNDYGHPAPELLTSLRDADVETLRTDQLGSISIGGRPGDLRVWSERDPRDVRAGK